MQKASNLLGTNFDIKELDYVHLSLMTLLGVAHLWLPQKNDQFFDPLPTTAKMNNRSIVSKQQNWQTLDKFQGPTPSFSKDDTNETKCLRMDQVKFVEDIL